jgi:hypothetical protein
MNKLKNLLMAGVVFTSLGGSPKLNFSFQNNSIYAQESDDETSKKSKSLIQFPDNHFNFFSDVAAVVFDEKFKKDIHPLIPEVKKYHSYLAQITDNVLNNRPDESYKKYFGVLLKQGLNEDNKYYREFKKENKKELESINDYSQKLDRDRFFLNWIHTKKIKGVENLMKGVGAHKDIYGIPEIMSIHCMKPGLYNNIDFDYSDVLDFPNSSYDFFISAGYEDKNKDGMISMDEITRIEDSNKLYFNKKDNLILGVNSKIGRIREGEILLYGPENKKILGSKFNIDSELIKGEFGLENIVDKNKTGTYKAVLLVDDKVNYVSQFEIRDE